MGWSVVIWKCVMRKQTFFMKEILCVGAGGALGTTLRYWISNLVPAVFGFSDIFTAILFENLTGSFLIGIIFTILTNLNGEKRMLHLFLLTGLIGSYTTYSGFILESIELLELSVIEFGIYFFGQVFFGVLSVFAGILLTEKSIKYFKRYSRTG